MAETNTQTSTPATTPAAKPARAGQRGGARRPQGSGDRRQGGRGPGRGRRDEREPREFEQKILELNRVTRVTAGGKRMSFRAALVIGDKKGRVGFGVAKGADVALSVDKAYRQAKKNMVTVPMKNGTIPHQVLLKYGSAQVMIKPAPQGTGLKCGGALRIVLELAGVPNAVSKVLNSSNKINIARATLLALRELRMPAKTAKSGSATEAA